MPLFFTAVEATLVTVLAVAIALTPFKLPLACLSNTEEVDPLTPLMASSNNNNINHNNEKHLGGVYCCRGILTNADGFYLWFCVLFVLCDGRWDFSLDG